MNILFSILIAISVNNTPPEQIAFNYFVNKILKENYPNEKKIFFSGKTEDVISIRGHFAKCFKSDSEWSDFFYKNKIIPSENLKIEINGQTVIRESAKDKAHKLNLIIYRALKKDDITYVHLEIYKVPVFADHYLFKLSSNNDIIEVCREPEIM